MMNWEQLLSLKRFGDTTERLRKDQDETRLGFEVDFDRIIFSSEFRSMQDKTQVVPLSQTDFVHTRLTHSLEVSVVGRSLGRIVGKQLLKKYPNLKEKGYQANDFGAIVAAASVMHDIGNPPFGHSGEKAIGEYFKTGNGKQFKEQLTAKQWQDLIDFEGNANGFRLVNETRQGIIGGIRLSYATLGAFLKYPKESLPKKATNHIAQKKFGVFQSDIELFKDVAQELGLLSFSEGKNIGYHRHPLAFLVEAADDICYTIIDFEDGINLGLIDESYALEYMTKLISNINREKYYSLQTVKDRISYLRAMAINNLIQEAASIFMQNEEAILKGDFSHGLLDKSKYEAQINDIIKLSVEKIYQSKDVVEKEVAGYQIINDLLDNFITATNNVYENNASNYDKLLLKTLPQKYTVILDNIYDRLLNVNSYVASLSDRAAVIQYNNLKGLNF